MKDKTKKKLDLKKKTRFGFREIIKFGIIVLL